MAAEVEAATGAVPAAAVEARVREDGTAEAGSSSIQVAEVWTSGTEVEGEEAEVGEADMGTEASTCNRNLLAIHLLLAFIIGYDYRHIALLCSIPHASTYLLVL